METVRQDIAPLAEAKGLTLTHHRSQSIATGVG